MRHSRKPRATLTFEARLRVFCTLAAVVILSLAAAVLALLHVSASPLLVTLGILGLILILVFATFIEDAVRPVQTLANVVAALREEDYSFRARNAGRDDSLGQLALEINALADTLQTQRVGALEAVALLRRVIAEMDAPVLAFDQESRLRLLNPAAERVFALLPARDLGRPAAELALQSLLDQPTDTVLPTVLPADTRPATDPGLDKSQSPRWMIRRGSFRQRGVPHTLVVLSDVSAALREEERLAWRRLIRVIGHEISNSLTPIKSIAGSLRSRLRPAPADGVLQRDLNRGLGVIENRAESLNRFVQAYRQLAQLPAPVLRRVPLVPLLERVVSLEIRLDVRILSAPHVDLLADPDQIEQLLINLVRNAVEAATFRAEEADLTQSDAQNEEPKVPAGDNALDDTENHAPDSGSISGAAKRHDGRSPGLEAGEKLCSEKRGASAPVPQPQRAEEVESPDLVSKVPAFSETPRHPCVTLRALEDGDLVAIRIEDNGPGLANPDNLFVPLYTTKKSGSGVGLALARQIVEAHGGAISLRNRMDGPGCLAEVRIPVAEKSRDPIPADQKISR